MIQLLVQDALTVYAAVFQGLVCMVAIAVVVVVLAVVIRLSRWIASRSS